MNFVRLPQVKKMTGLGRSTIYEYMREGRFPLPVDLSGNGRVKAWIDEEVQQWMEKRISVSRGAS